ncbi:unnamed protein product, partial [Gulo gulo]
QIAETESIKINKQNIPKFPLQLSPRGRTALSGLSSASLPPPGLSSPCCSPLPLWPPDMRGEGKQLREHWGLSARRDRAGAECGLCCHLGEGHRRPHVLNAGQP